MFQGQGRQRILNYFMLFMILCASFAGLSHSQKETQLIVSAAASLQDPLKVIQQLYIKDKPGVKIVINFGSSGALRQQIMEGAPVDIYFPAATQDMDLLEAKQLVLSRTRIDLLKNSLVLIVSKNETSIKDFEDLISPKLSQFALGNPESVPAGMYTREVLTYLGIWKQVQTKAVFAKDVKQVLTWVATENINAGFVYRTDAKLSDDVKVVAVAPDESHSPIVYPVAVVKASSNRTKAKNFVQYLDSDKAKQVFLKFGFTINKSSKTKE